MSKSTMVSHKQLAMTHRSGTFLWSGLIGSLVLSLLATPAQAAGLHEIASHKQLATSPRTATFLWVTMAFSFVVSLLATPILAEHVGDCYDDNICMGKQTASVSGNPQPNNELKINAKCTSFHSDIGSPYKVDLCTNTACTRIQYNQCYNDNGGYKYVEFVE